MLSSVILKAKGKVIQSKPLTKKVLKLNKQQTRLFARKAKAEATEGTDATKVEETKVKKERVKKEKPVKKSDLEELEEKFGSLSDPNNHKKLFDWLAEADRFNVTSWPNDWYRLGNDDAKKIKGLKNLLADFYQDSLATAVMKIYPDYEWQPWRFKHIPENYWERAENHKLYLDWIADRLNITKYPDDWYNVAKKELVANHGKELLKDYYNDSLYQALIKVYPNYEWLPWKFNKNPKATLLKNQDDLNKFIAFYEKKLNIKTPEEWYKITAAQLNDAAPAIDAYEGGIIEIMRRAYPLMDWQQENFLYKKTTKRERAADGAGYSGQIHTFKVGEREIQVIEEYKHPILRHDSGEPMEFDVYIPALNLAFEYQGIHHYQPVSSYGNWADVRKRDANKIKKCEENGITLIEVPYWWDMERDSLANTIHERRPDLIAKPIGDGKAIPPEYTTRDGRIHTISPFTPPPPTPATPAKETTENTSNTATASSS